MNDHLGTPITIGCFVAYTYQSPVAEDVQMTYAVLQEIKPSKARGGAPIFSVIPIIDYSDFQHEIKDLHHATSDWEKQYFKDLFKRKGLKSQYGFTVVDFHRMPQDAQDSWNNMQTILSEGLDNFIERIAP